MLKFFLVGVFCLTQPKISCERVASTMYYHTEEQCLIAAYNFDQVMKAKYPDSKTTLHCVDAFPIPANPGAEI
jgi:hypothetical protein